MTAVPSLVKATQTPARPCIRVGLQEFFKKRKRRHPCSIKCGTKAFLAMLEHLVVPAIPLCPIVFCVPLIPVEVRRARIELFETQVSICKSGDSGGIRSDGYRIPADIRHLE